MNIFFGQPDSVPAVRDAISRYGDKEFESPTRSTVPMLSVLIDSPKTFDEIIGKLGMPAKPNLYLEYTVASAKGKGKASHTDVMLKSGSSALAIEAKWTEPMYPTVGEWLKKGDSQSNKKQVLEGWLSLLGKYLDKELDPADFGKSIYQMVHRAASAAASGDDARLAYFLFKPSPDRKAATSDQVFKKLDQLWKRLGKPESFPFSVVEIEMESTPAYEAIKNRPKGKSQTAEVVIAAMLDDAPLFRFTGFDIKTVGADS